MKKNSPIKFMVILCIMFAITAFKSQSIPDEIYSAIKSGNSKELAKYFNNNIDLVILDKEGVYSKSQAELILKDFFSKNAVNPTTGFIKLHEGGKDASKFIIGTLYTNKGQFRVYILMKTISGAFAIHQFRIEDDSN
jgi:hypothetical protein